MRKFLYAWLILSSSLAFLGFLSIVFYSIFWSQGFYGFLFVSFLGGLIWTLLVAKKRKL